MHCNHDIYAVIIGAPASDPHKDENSNKQVIPSLCCVYLGNVSNQDLWVEAEILRDLETKQALKAIGKFS